MQKGGKNVSKFVCMSKREKGERLTTEMIRERQVRQQSYRMKEMRKAAFEKESLSVCKPSASRLTRVNAVPYLWASRHLSN